LLTQLLKLQEETGLKVISEDELFHSTVLEDCA